MFRCKVLVCLVVAQFLVSLICASRQIKNWNAKIDFDFPRDNTFKDARKFIRPESKIHSFLETFTFRKDFITENQAGRGKGTLQSDVESERPKFGTIHQDFDHFGDSPENADNKWTQHFYSLSTQNESLPPTEINFLMLEGEGGFSESWISDSWAFVEWARDYGATAYTLEHRFYGDSDSEIVSGNVDIERLTLLTSEQALADAAIFIENVNRQKNFTNPRWISFGGSYPGNLAAWIRLKYPDLIHGAIASSAPVFAKTDFYEYLQVVEKSFELWGSEGCADAILDFFSRSEQLLKTSEGRKQLRICEPKGGELSRFDAQLFLSGHLGSLSKTVQYDDSGHYKMNKTCRYYKGWINWLDQLAKNSSLDSGSCTTYNFETDMASFNESKSLTYYWYWQTCNEFGYFQTSDKAHSKFSIYQDALEADFFVAMCEVIFGKQFDREYTDIRVDYTNLIYGGVENFNTTNVVFLNGSEDPWHALSVLSNKSDSIQSYLIDGTSHCYDMYALTEWSTDGLKQSHKIARSALKQWLS